MISAVSSVSMNKNYRTSFQGGPVVEQQYRETKDGMSTSQKTLIGLGAAAALVIGGLMVKRHLDSNSVKNLLKSLNNAANELPIPSKKMLEKPHEFSQDFLEKNIAKKWYKEGKLQGGDEIILAPKSTLEKIFQVLEDKKYITAFKDMNMSNNGFAAFVQKADGSIDLSIFRYFDPETNSNLKMVNALKNDKLYVHRVVD